MQIKNEKDFWSGVMFTVLGVAFAGFAQEYELGTGQRMGPAFFPTVLGILLALLGVIIALTGLAAEGHDGKVEKFHFDIIAWIIGSIVAFGLLLRPGGIVVALVALIGLSAVASHEFKLRESVILTVGLIGLVLAVFIYGLKLTIPVLPAFMQN